MKSDYFPLYLYSRVDLTVCIYMYAGYIRSTAFKALLFFVRLMNRETPTYFQ